MIRRDYILRMIEELAQALRRVRKQVEAGEFAEANGELDKVFAELIGSGAEAVSKLSETELVAKLTLDGPTQMVREKTLILVALLQKAGEVRIAEGRNAEGYAVWLKALNLLLTVHMQDQDLEMPEFVPKIDFLRDELKEAELPLQTLAALWRHYEYVGAYAKAEDALGNLLEAEPDNDALRSEAKAFYQRLLNVGDASLNEGNLPRAEVEAALKELGGFRR